MKIGSATSGSINASDLFPTSEWGTKIDQGYQNLQQSQAQVDAWWNSLTPTQQKNPVNVAKHNTANAVLATAGSILNAASGAISNAGNSTVQYSLDKRQKNLWNFIVGGQFQINKSWMIRAEYGFLGSRMQFIGGLQWRFGL